MRLHAELTRRHGPGLPLLATGLVAVLATACGSSTPSSSSSTAPSSSAPLIVEVSGTLTNPWFGAEKAGVDAAGKAVGANVQFIATDVTSGGMVKAIQEAVTEHAAAIAVHDWYPSAEDPAIQAAISAGVPVIEVDAAGPNWQSSGVLGFIGQTDAEAGAQGAARLLAAGAKHLLFVNHAPGAVNLATRWANFQPAVQAAGGTVTQLNISFADSTNPTAVTQDIKGALIANSSIDGVFTNGASIAEDAVLAISQAGLSGKIQLGTTDLSTGDLNDIAKGSVLFALDSQPYEIGYYAVTTLFQYVTFGMSPVGQISTGPNAITKNNVQQVLTENTKYPGIRGAA